MYTQKWLIAVTGKKKYYVVALILVQAAVGSVGVFFALLLRNIIDSAVNNNIKSFWTYVTSIVFLVLLQVFMQAIIRFLRELAKSDIENTLKLNLISNILSKNYVDVNSIHTAEWINRITNDAKITSEHYVEIIPDFVETAVRLISALIMIIILDSRFAYILIPSGIIFFILTYSFRRVLQSLHKNIQEQDGKFRIFLQEYIGSLIMIKSFCAETQTITEAQDRMNNHKTARMKRNHFSNICNIGFSGIMNGMYIFAVVYCAHGIITGIVSYGTLTAIMQLIAQIQSPFANISVYIPRYYAMIASAERLMYAERFADELEKKDLASILNFYNNEFVSLNLDNISFQYKQKSDAEFAIKNLSLEIKKGDYLAFTGHSGCGKSTILKLLMCMYPIEHGERFMIASKNKENLTEAWRRLFAYVPQDNTLIKGSIRDIVSFSDEVLLESSS